MNRNVCLDIRNSDLKRLSLYVSHTNWNQPWFLLNLLQVLSYCLLSLSASVKAIYSCNHFFQNRWRRRDKKLRRTLNCFRFCLSLRIFWERINCRFNFATILEIFPLLSTAQLGSYEMVCRTWVSRAVLKNIQVRLGSAQLMKWALEISAAASGNSCQKSAK